MLDLGDQPLANAFRLPDDTTPEARYPLKLCVCQKCALMQLERTVPPETLFRDYLYFTSCSAPMVEHARKAAQRYIQDFLLKGEVEKGHEKWVVEVASNDGYMLQWFKQAGVPCYGIEPAKGPAAKARAKGIETVEEFFTAKFAAGRGPMYEHKATLLLANNVFAHCPDINDFVCAIRESLTYMGRAILEFPYGMNLLDRNEFDTVYHEHVFYFTLTPLIPLFQRHGLEIYRVEHLSVHGGALRIFAARKGQYPVEESVTTLAQDELKKGVFARKPYEEFSKTVRSNMGDLIQRICTYWHNGKKLAVYGASAKSTVLLNALGYKGEVFDCIFDNTPEKQGRLSPGLGIPIVSPRELTTRQPDYCLLSIWNFLDQVLKQEQEYRRAGGKFIVPVPKVEVV